MVRKAKRALVAARSHVKAGDYDFASSRAYYAAFYSMEAALLERGLVFSKHSGVMAGFALNFVKTGVFPKDFSKQIARLFRERQIGDYEFEISISAKAAKEDIRHATVIVHAIDEYLNSSRRNKIQNHSPAIAGRRWKLPSERG
jgi:uncharacterized protein (UPF0332 family)